MDSFTKRGDRWEIVKDPDAVIDYTFDWRDWLMTDEISTAAITVADSATMTKGSTAIHDGLEALAREMDITLAELNARNAAGELSPTEQARFDQSETDCMVTVWLSAGAARDLASVTCRITTVGGRTDDRTMYVRVKER